MNFSSMDYFVTIARVRSFTKAAEQLHITQQTLSSHIAALEQELGSQLLVRHVPLELTYAGEVFLKYAQEFQQNVRDLKKEFCDITENQRGVLRIGIAHTRGRALLPALIPAFQKKYPNISVEVTERSNMALHRSLLNGEIDLAIANFPEALQGVELEEYYQEEVVLLMENELFVRLYASSSGETEERFIRGELSELQHCPFVLNNSEDIAGRIALNVIQKAGVRPVVKVRSDNLETLLALCVQGTGACFCPENLAKKTLSPEQLAALKVVRLGESARYQIRFGYIRQSYQWSILSEFMNIARENL